MSIRDARRVASRTDKTLILDGQVSVESIRRAIEALRGITSTVQEVPADQHDVPALTADCGNLNVVYYAPNLSTLHRQHNILHEFSRRFLRHEQIAAGITTNGFSATFLTQTQSLFGRDNSNNDADQTIENPGLSAHFPNQHRTSLTRRSRRVRQSLRLILLVPACTTANVVRLAHARSTSSPDLSF